MATNSRMMPGVQKADVLAVLTDGWSYEHWVVGTRKIRAVDADWPAPTSRLHYTVGYWPMRKDGATVALEHDPGQRLVLEAQAWPAGTAKIVLTVTDQPAGALVEIEEHPNKGIAARIHNPAMDLALKVRNVETLRRLEVQARRRRDGR